MKTEQKECKNCEKVTKQKALGFVPVESLKKPNVNTEQWVNTTICSECGSHNVVEVTDSQVRRADEKYLHTLVEMDMLTRQEAKELLGIE